MITEAKTAFAVRDVELTSCFIRGNDLFIRQFRTITFTHSILAVSEIPLVVRRRHFTSFGRCQLRPVAGTHTVSAIGDVLLVLGNG